MRLFTKRSSYEDRVLTRGGTVPEVMFTGKRTALHSVSQHEAMSLADVYAAIRVLADSVASLPPRVYRDTPTGKQSAGDSQRLVQLLRRPTPGSTSADLFSDIMVSLCLDGNAFVGKYRSEGTITMLGCLDPQCVTVELRGGQIVYKYSGIGTEGYQELGPADVLHIKGMSADRLRGASPVAVASRALQLNSGLIDYLCAWLGNDSRPAGVLYSRNPFATPTGEDVKASKEYVKNEFGWQRKPPGMGGVMVAQGELGYLQVDPPLKDQEFLAHREFSTREVARIFRLPPWSLGASTGDSLTYSNVADQNRHLADWSLRPWLYRIETAFTNDPDLCPGGVYLSIDTDALLRANPKERAEYYTAALDPNTGWLSRAEVRAMEDLPPESD